MEYYNPYEPYELTHWGIKNMKWGIRRFQNKDGSLTPEGGKRYNGSDYQPRKSLGQKISDYKKASAKKKQLEKARAARAEKKRAEEEAKAKAEQRKKDVESGKIKAKDMTSEELRDRINRMNDEKRYKQLMEETGHTSVIETYGKQFAKKMWNDAIVPAATEAGKELVKKAILDASKKDAPVEEFNLDKMWKNRNKMTTKQIKDVQDRLNAENAIKKMMDKREKDKRAEDQAKKEKKEAKDPEKTEEVKNTKDKTNSGQNSKKNSNSANDISNKKTKDEQNSKTKTAEPTVEGEGKSKYSNKPQGEQYYVKNPTWSDIDMNTKVQVEKALTKYGNISTSSKEFEVYSAEGKKLSKDILNNIEFAAPMNNRKNRWNKPDE